MKIKRIDRKLYIGIIVAAVLIACVGLIYAREKDFVKSVPEVQEVPTPELTSCTSAADCEYMNYCTDREPPECHGYLCIRGTCQEPEY